MSFDCLLIYDDERSTLGPMTELRPVYELRTGVFTTQQRIERALNRDADALASHDRICTAPRGTTLCVNGAWHTQLDTELLRQLPVGSAVEQEDGRTLAAHLDRDAVLSFQEGSFASLPETVQTRRVTGNRLVAFPWDILSALPRTLSQDIQEASVPVLGATEGVYTMGNHAVKVDSSATLCAPISLDASQGPILIEQDAVVMPFCALQGPCAVMRGATLVPHTTLRSNTVVGPRCHVGGELVRSVLHSDTHKAHHGYLGDALVGAWCNLGAGTTASNLKNTFGPVRVQLDADGPEVDTGRTKIGPILGDFVRTAIGTRLNTGSVVGTGAMLACSGFAPRFVDAFSWVVDQGISLHTLEGLLKTLDAMATTLGQPVPDPIRSRLIALHEQRAKAVS